MTEAYSGDFEGLLRQALAPVEPPDNLYGRLESALTEITELAADELEAWELSAMRDPRNWVRPVAALALGTSAGAALLVLRMRSRRRRNPSLKHPVDLLERTAERVADEARRDAPR